MAAAAVAAWLLVGPPPSGFGLDAPAVRDAIGSFSAAQRAAAYAYQSSVVWPITLALLSSTIAALIFGFTRAGDVLVGALRRRLGNWLSAVLAAASLVIIGSLCALPFDYWAYRVRVDAGLVVADAWSWLLDRSIMLAVTLVISVLAVSIALFCVRVARARWWLPAAGIAGIAVIVAAWAYPVVVEPLLTQTTPISDTKYAGQEAELRKLARSDGFVAKQILVSNASAKTTTFNAYVSGYDGRIVIFDNLLKSSTPARVQMVVAHELGHATRNDVLLGALIAAVAAMGVIALLGAFFAQVDAWAIPRIFAVVALVSLIAMPATAFISRSIEWRADAYALALTGDRDTFVQMQRELAVANKSALDPPQWRYWWFFTHPTSPQRIAFGEAWTSAR